MCRLRTRLLTEARMALTRQKVTLKVLNPLQIRTGKQINPDWKISQTHFNPNPHD